MHNSLRSFIYQKYKSLVYWYFLHVDYVNVWLGTFFFSEKSEQGEVFYYV